MPEAKMELDWAVLGKREEKVDENVFLYDAPVEILSLVYILMQYLVVS